MDQATGWTATVAAAAAVATGRRLWVNRPAERARSAAERGAEHRRRQILNAADWAISGAVPRREDGIRTVLVADVQARAEADFDLRVSRAEAGAALWQRLELRLRIGIETDLP
ncbi:hypothetical protein [Kitasatospora sp. HPMI-4]|uniref:hypothetical protein n=1 Tax=Kitasatospora sp. HPMI-4 TaxID=3448443 RepID=UPI003F1C499D